MIHSVVAQAMRLKAGENPDYALIEVLENVKDETRYLGAITEEAGERWPDKDLYSANFYADKAIGKARQSVRARTTNTTATPDTIKRLNNDVLYYLEKVEGYLS